MEVLVRLRSARQPPDLMSVWWIQTHTVQKFTDRVAGLQVHATTPATKQASITGEG